MVGKTGLEPMTFCVSDRRSKPAELHPNIFGGQGGNWTRDTWIFSPVLYHLSYLSKFGYQYVKEQKKPEPCEFGFPFWGYYVLT